MRYRRLGSAGIQVSELSFGSWVTFGQQYGVDEALACMEAAYEAGVNFFDNAEAYAGGKSETLMGEAIRKAGWNRADLVVSTKIFFGGQGPNQKGLSRKHVIDGMRASLDRMQLDYVDLVFCHRPDPNTPMLETVRAMSWVVDQGWAHYWGTSEWSAEQIRHAHGIAEREHLNRPQMEQPQYNMFHRERVEKEYAPLYEDIGLGTTIWSPLASGMLTGKYNEGIPEGSRATLPNYKFIREGIESDEGQARIDKVKQLMPIAGELGCSIAQLALAWCLKFDGVSTVITGASRAEQVSENMGALDVVDKLDESVMERIEAILGNRPV
ncbi:MAG: aldo/keto reductase [Planctomycetales bacterium]|nr:aldo/keto reductase [bacterium]UNM09100.1 MAG: aldo/keto reductase [Planctomycetales bacterium]